MWRSEKRGWRAAVFAACCAGLIMEACDASAADVPADTGTPPPPGTRDRASERAAGESRGWFEGWGLPPVRWGGSLISEVRLEQAGDQPRRLQQNEISNIKAASYVWQPWLAQVSGGLGLLLSKERSSEDASLGGDHGRKASSSAVTGNGEVTLFPVSRFPFNAYVDVSDSRASGELAAGGDVTSRRFGLRQAYRPVEGTSNYSASFNRSTLESPQFGRDTVNALAASMNRSVGAQALDLSGSHTRNMRSNTGESTALTQLSARHSYRPEPMLSVESLASASAADFHLLSAGVPSDNRSRFAQASSFATWRPEEGSPLSVTGGGRMFRSAIASNGGESESLTLSGNIGATYALTPRTSIAGGATVTQLLVDGAGSLLTTQTASATHIGDPVGIYGFTYTWNAGANIANQTGLAEGARQNLGGQLGHNLTRAFALGEGSQLNVGIGQNIGTTFDTVTARSQTLGHNASVSWRVARDAATTAYLSVLGADSRTSGQNENQFQLVNLQASGQMQFSRNALAAANLTVQGARQRTGSTPSAGFSFNSSGNLSYHHLRAFDVPRLRYSAIYSINESQFKTRLQGDVNAPREQVTQSLEQRLDWNVGRIEMRLSMRVAYIDGERHALVFFRLGRQFGNF